MVEVFFNGPDGRIEGRYTPGEHKDSPVALVLHPHPLHGGTMNNKVVYTMYQSFIQNGFATLRINFRGVGRSQGKFDNGVGELTDAATALDWLQDQNEFANNFWISGFSFGAWIALQLLMRRPEIQHFVAVSPPAGKYDFSFLSPCPTSGFIVQGDKDSIVAEQAVADFANKLNKQRGIEVGYKVVHGGDHFFREKLDMLKDAIDEHIKYKMSISKPKKIKHDRRRRQQSQED
jgi:alpha/beta superfamily hydrolase